MEDKNADMDMRLREEDNIYARVFDIHPKCADGGKRNNDWKGDGKIDEVPIRAATRFGYLTWFIVRFIL